MDSLATSPSVATTAAPDVSSALWFGVEPFLAFEFLCLVVFVLSGLALRLRRAQLFARQQLRYSRLAQYNAAHAYGASQPPTPVSASNAGRANSNLMM